MIAYLIAKVGGGKEGLLRDGMWAAGGKCVSMGCTFLFNALLARIVSPAEYGAYFVLLDTLIIVSTFGALGADQIVVVEVGRDLEKNDGGNTRAIVFSCLMIAGAGAALSAAIYLVLGGRLFSVLRLPQLAPLVGVSCAWIVVSIFQRQLAESFRALRMIDLASIFGGLRANGILLSLLSVLTAIALSVYEFRSLKAVVVASAAIAMAVAAAGAVFLARRLRTLAGCIQLASNVNALWLALAAAPLWLSTVILTLRFQTTGWLAGYFDSAENVALFGVAMRLVFLLTAPMVVVNSVLPPVIARLFANQAKRELEAQVQRTCWLAFVTAFLMLVVLSVFGKMLLVTAFGSFYATAYPVLILLAVGQIVGIAAGAWSVVLPMCDQGRAALSVSVVSAICHLTFCWLGARQAGVLGLAAGFLISSLLINAAGVITVRKKLGIWCFSWPAGKP
jgi:O-antigen/teichoic acid export membrane protein